jgi:hypothetical protein
MPMPLDWGDHADFVGYHCYGLKGAVGFYP